MFRNATSLSSSTTPSTTPGGGDNSTASGHTSGPDVSGSHLRSNKTNTDNSAPRQSEAYTQKLANSALIDLQKTASPNSPGGSTGLGSGNNNQHTPTAKYENLLSVSTNQSTMSIGQSGTVASANHETLHQMNNATSPPNYLASYTSQSNTSSAVNVPNLGSTNVSSPGIENPNSYHTLNQTTM